MDQDRIIEVVASRHGVLLEKDDPALTFATIVEAQVTDAVTAGMRTVDDQMVQKVIRAAANGANQRSAELVRSHYLKLTMAGVLISLTIIGMAFGTGFWVGRPSTVTCQIYRGGRVCQYWETPPRGRILHERPPTSPGAQPDQPRAE